MTRFVLLLFCTVIWNHVYAGSNGFLKISCQGEGPSLALARKKALKDCHASAADQLRSDFKVKSLTVQTETDAVLHDEILSNQVVENLKCLNQKEKVEETPSSFKVKLDCEYDATKVKFAIGDDSSTELRKDDEEKLIDTDGGQAVSIATVPACSSIIIQSKRTPRVVHCKSSPVRLVIQPGDTNIIIRATGYKPKEMTADALRRSNVHQVFLSP